MVKNAVLMVIVAGALVALYGFVGTYPVQALSARTAAVPHFYGKPDIPIDRIEIVALYFVPKDRLDAINGSYGVSRSDWRGVLTEHFESLKAFHELQFLGRSAITYSFLPDAVVGQEDQVHYEVSTPSHTDPLSIDPIARELSARLLDPSGDLWQYESARAETDARRVYFVMFEGDGAAGSGDVALVSRELLTEEAYAPYSATFLAHEFYHTLGVPDAYESSQYVYEDAQQTIVGLLKSRDIMGRVRVPLRYTYLEGKTREAMGI